MTESIDEPAEHPLVTAAVARLDELTDRPVGEHVAVFEQVHDQLRRALDPSR